MIKRVLLIVFDGLGIGSYVEAEDYNSLYNTIKWCEKSVQPELETLNDLGLEYLLPNQICSRKVKGCYGKTRQQSFFCDSFSAHWEMAGNVINDGVEFTHGIPFEYRDKIKKSLEIEFVGNEICYEEIEKLSPRILEKHIQEKKPILLTIPKKEPISTVAIVSLENVVSFAKLDNYASRIAQLLRGSKDIGRIVAKTLTHNHEGVKEGDKRSDYPVFQPPNDDLLKALQNANITTCATGKINGLFNGNGFACERTSWDNETIWSDTMEFFESFENAFVWANLNSLDRPYGHKRNPAMWLKTLNEYDRHLKEVIKHITEDDLLIITGDHGCDPTREGNHTREWNPLFVYNPCIVPKDLGEVVHLDIAETIADVFGINLGSGGTSFWNKIHIGNKRVIND